jgi:uncharacterized protein YfaS (alpha-2-macroglobulin family)
MRSALTWSKLLLLGGLLMMLVDKGGRELKGAAAPGKDLTEVLGGAERYLAHLSTDKPIYRPGETAYVRAFVLEARTHRPWTAALNGIVTIKGPRGEKVTSGGAYGTDGVLGFAWRIPDDQTGGEYTLVLTSPQAGFPAAERKIDVREFRAPRLKTQIDFARDGYGPGDRVAATLHCERAEGGSPTGAKVTVTARVDDAEVYRGTTRVDASGHAIASFVLPSTMARGEGTLVMTIEDGGVVETAAKTLPILLQTLDLALYPEGGDLVSGLKTRLYFEARTPAKKPADIEAVILDDREREVSRCKSEHEGRGRCALLPERGRRYTLKVTAPAGVKTLFPLPAVKDDGAVLSATSDTIGRGEPARFTVASTRAGKLTLTVRQREDEVGRATVTLKKKSFWGFAGSAGQSVPVTVALPSAVDGVLVATLWAEDGTPLAERLVFRVPASTTRVTIKADQARYEPGGTAKLEITTRDEAGKPVSALVGVTVTDESVLEMVERREQAPRLPVMVFLEPEVRELADAHVYLDPKNPKAPLATDLLLGTQGWRRFALRDVEAFVNAHGDAARRALAWRTPPPPPPRPMMRRAFMEVAEGARERPAAAMPAMPLMAEAKAVPREAGRGAAAALKQVRRPVGVPVVAGREPLAGDAFLARRERARHAQVAQQAPGIAWVREYSHTVRPDRKPQDRVDFTETLYFAAGVRTDASGHASVSFGLSDAVTAYRASGDAVSATGALGAGTLTFESVQPFYIEPKMPLVLTTGDRADVPLAFVNNTSAGLDKVRLEVKGPAGLRIEAPAEVPSVPEASRMRTLVRLDTTGFVGKVELTFSARAGNYADTVTRSLEVQPRGFPVEIARGGLLESNRSISVPVTLTQGIAPGSLSTEIVVYPTPLASLTQALERLMREPYGCFEQTSSTTYPLTMAQQYFTSHAGVDPALVARSNELLLRGYKRLTSFECQNKGYEWFGGSAPGHEALTAYGLMQFGDMARAHLRLVDAAMMQRTRAWLLGRRDGKGGFQRNQRALDSFGGAPEDTTNAYIVWALLESGEGGLEKEIAAAKAIASHSADTYVVALGANIAVLSHDTPVARALMRKLADRQGPKGAVEGATTSITRSRGEALGIETTSLATLAWLREPTFVGNVERAVRFLAESCQGGRFSSTQATILALKAIVAYDAARARAMAPGSLSVALDGHRVGEPVTFTADSEGVLTLPSLVAALSAGHHTIELRMNQGAQMPFSVAVRYQTLTPVSSEGTPLRLSTALATPSLREGEVTEARVEVANTGSEPSATPLAIIGVPAGLEVRHDQLKELVKAERIAAYEVSDREVILYWRELKAGARVSLPLSFVAAVPGLYHGPASRAYAYYNDESKRWVSGLTVEVTPATH